MSVIGKKIIKIAYISKKSFLFLFSILFERKMIIMDKYNTIDYIVNNNCSVARYGNGEMDIMLGDSKHFQKYNPKLAKELSSIKTDRLLLVCVPIVLENKNALKEQNNTFYKKHRRLYLHYWRKLFASNSALGDSCFTRFYMDLKIKDNASINNYLKKLFKIWEARDVVIIEGQFTRFGVGNLLLKNAKSVKRIICPNEDAYDVIDRIEHYVLNNVSLSSLLLISLGPTATVLAWRLSRHSFQAIDIGHLDIEYEWCLRGLEKKEAIQNKYTNEVDNGRITHDSFESIEYSQQIIQKIL